MIDNEKIPADALLLAMAIAAATSCAGGGPHELFEEVGYPGHWCLQCRICGMGRNPHIHIGKKTLKVE